VDLCEKGGVGEVRKVVNNSKTLIPSESKWKYINLNPTALSNKD